MKTSKCIKELLVDKATSYKHLHTPWKHPVKIQCNVSFCNEGLLLILREFIFLTTHWILPFFIYKNIYKNSTGKSTFFKNEISSSSSFFLRNVVIFHSRQIKDDSLALVNSLNCSHVERVPRFFGFCLQSINSSKVHLGIAMASGHSWWVTRWDIFVYNAGIAV